MSNTGAETEENETVERIVKIDCEEAQDDDNGIEEGNPWLFKLSEDTLLNGTPAYYSAYKRTKKDIQYQR